ncbi:hypothetical protein ACJ2A9_12555 [Anaerobacillus sp. MEB173]|uniref:hypothetical protein n=1 Tax=Anaerobacillus sp. MEB173 TaxID=3383345 RepID=UPI003F8E51F6
MNLKTNNQGSALLIVLLITLVFTVLGMSLISMNINNTKQVFYREVDLQATNLAEMGVDLYINSIEASINDSLEPLDDYIDQLYDDPEIEYSEELEINELIRLIEQEMDTKILSQEIIVYEDQEKYAFRVQSPFTSTKNYSIDNDGNDKIRISFISTGYVENEMEKSLLANFTISKESITSPSDGNGSNENIVNNCTSGETPNKININNNCTTTGSVTYSKNVNIRGSHSLKVNGEARFNNGLELRGNPAKLCVKGNLFVTGGQVNVGNNANNKADIYVYGTHNITNHSVITVDSFDELKTYCGSFSESNSSSPTFEWGIDYDLSNIEYIYNPIS